MKELDIKTNQLLEILKQDSRILEIEKYKQNLLNNQEMLNKMIRLRQLDIYSNEYKELKMELFQELDFVMFKHLENEINLLIMEINSRLRVLVDGRGCGHENN